jgi:hypothetical protein
MISERLFSNKWKYLGAQINFLLLDIIPFDNSHRRGQLLNKSMK